MIHLKIGNKKVKLFTDWGEITIARAIELSKVERPKSFDPDIDIVWGREWSRFADACFRILIDTEIDGRLNPIMVESYYRGFVHELVCDLVRLWPQKYRIRGIEYFKHNGVKYHVPASLQIDDAVIPAYQESAETWVEASDLLRGISEVGFELLPALIATYCRPEGKGFDEAGQLARAEAFKDLPMDIGWEVFFSAIRCSNMLISDFTSHVQEQVASLKRQLRFLALPRWAIRAYCTVFQKRA